MKHCPKCKLNKNLLEFGYNKRNWDGRHTYCQSCKRKVDKEWRAKPEINQKLRIKDKLRGIAQKARIDKYQQWYRDTHKEKISRYNKTYWKKLHGRWMNCKNDAKRREKTFSLTEEEFSSFWKKPCHYCGLPVDTVGLDRVDNNKGYSLDNCVSCCETCNRMKMKHSVSEWFSHMILIISNNLEKL